MSDKYTLWNIPGDSWQEMPQDLELSEQVNERIKEALNESVDTEELRAYRVPVDQEQLAKIVG